MLKIFWLLLLIDKLVWLLVNQNTIKTILCMSYLDPFFFFSLIITTFNIKWADIPQTKNDNFNHNIKFWFKNYLLINLFV